MGQNPELVESASIKFIALSLRQDLIVKSRILWERIMGLIHFIETGKPDLPRTKRSAKEAFFNVCRDTPHWKWLGAYELMVTAYDDDFRTPEVHKRSVLRGGLLRGRDLDELDIKLLQPLNDAVNQIWANLTSIVGGGGVVSLGRVHITFDDQGRPVGGDQWRWQPSDSAGPF